MNTLSKAFAVILAILLLYIYPISEAFERQDDISYEVALRAVTNFVDSARNTGFVSPQMYADLQEQLAATGNVYDIQMEHDHKKYDTYVVDSTTTPVTYGYQVDYDDFYTQQIMDVLYPSGYQNISEKDPSRQYKMSVGDYFSVTIKNKNKTSATILRDFLNNSSSDATKIVIPYGGMVQNEDY